MPCPCDTPAERRTDGRMLMRVRIGHTRQKVKRALAATGLHHDVDGELVYADVEGERQADELYDCLNDALSPVERDDIRAVFLSHHGEPRVADYFEIDSLDRHLGILKAGWLSAVLNGETLTSVMQPIVEAARPTVAFGYEALLRVRSKDAAHAMRSPEDVFSIARRAGLLPALDRAARESAIVNAVPHLNGARLFINFTPSSIYDPVSCLQTTVALLEKYGVAHERVVFEVIETERIGDTGHLRNILAFYRDRGFGVALDDLGSGYATLKLLNELRPDYAKIDIELISGVDHDPYKAALAEKLIEAAHRISLPLVAEGVETAEEFAWVRDRGVQFVQGFYVAKPAMPPHPLHAA